MPIFDLVTHVNVDRVYTKKIHLIPSATFVPCDSNINKVSKSGNLWYWETYANVSLSLY